MVKTSSISAFILAGGRSSRLGRDKALLIWRGRTLIDHMVHRLLPIFRPVRVVGRGDLPDVFPNQGPLGGILTALEACETQRTLVVAVDLPLLTPESLKLFRTRIQASEKHVIASKLGSAYPLCLGLDRDVLPLVRQRIETGQLSIQGFLEASDVDPISGIDATDFTNINSPEDWAAIQDLE